MRDSSKVTLFGTVNKASRSPYGNMKVDSMNDVLNDEFSLETTLKQALKLADELDFPLVSIRIAEALDQLHRDTFGGELD